MNYRLASVFSYKRLENALICIISIGPSTELRPILNFPMFRKNGASLEFLNVAFEIVYQKGFFFGEIKKKFAFFDVAPDSPYLQTTALVLSCLVQVIDLLYQ